MAISHDQETSIPKNPQPPLTPDVCQLLRSPTKWTAKHLEIARVHQIDSSPSDILDPKFLPPDNDPLFQRLASTLCDPSLNTPTMDRAEIQTKQPFYQFWMQVRSSLWFVQSSHRLSQALLDDLLYDICHEMYPDRTLLGFSGFRSLPMELPFWKTSRKNTVQTDGLVRRYWPDRKLIGVPLLVGSVMREPGETGLAKYQIPQILLQINAAYNANKNLPEYTAFILSVETYTFTINRAVVPPEYIRSIHAGGPVCGEMRFYHGPSFDITDLDRRRELLRFIMGLGRYFVKRPEFEFPGRPELDF